MINSRSWTGGYNYLLNLFRAIQNCNVGRISLILFCGEDATDNDLQPFFELGDVNIIRSSVFDADQKSANILRALFTGLDSRALQLFRQHRIDVVFESATFYGWRFPIPTIAWLPDFQHRHLPEQFGFVAYWRREAGFRAQVASGRMLMLSSEDARKDCEHFYPGAMGNTAVVHFATPIPQDLIEPLPEKVLQEYRLPPQFFYLPNQFWKHKNHAVVIEALGVLKQQGLDVVVAVSGNPLDPRHPGYVDQLNARIAALGLQDNFRILGMVPRRHVISLLRTCTALINPSFFEGWSSTVEEARALGVPMLLSDIGVHREQMGEAASFFEANDVLGLAEKLKKIVAGGALPISIRKPLSESEENTCRFARDFVSVVESGR